MSHQDDIAHVDPADILKRLGDVVVSWPRLMAPGEMVSVRADLIVSAYSEIDQLREKAK